jgi:hypothetical protein
MQVIPMFLSQECIDDFEDAYSDFAIDCAFSMKSGEFNVMSGAYIQLLKRYFPSVVETHGADAVKIAFSCKFLEEAIGSKYTILSSVNTNLTLIPESYKRSYYTGGQRYQSFFKAENMVYADKNSFSSMGFFVAIALINSDFKLKLKELFDYKFSIFCSDIGYLPKLVNELQDELGKAGLWSQVDHINLTLAKSVLLKDPVLRYPYDQDNLWDSSVEGLNNSALFPIVYSFPSRKYASVLNTMLASPNLHKYSLDVDETNKCFIAAGYELLTLKSHLHSEDNKRFNLQTLTRYNTMVTSGRSSSSSVVKPTAKYKEEEKEIDAFFVIQSISNTMALCIASAKLWPKEGQLPLPDVEDLDNDAIQHFNECFEVYYEFFVDLHTVGTEFNKAYTLAEALPGLDEKIVNKFVDQGFSVFPQMFINGCKETFFFDTEDWAQRVVDYNNHITPILKEIHKECIEEIFKFSSTPLLSTFALMYEAHISADKFKYNCNVHLEEYLLSNGHEKTINIQQPLNKSEKAYEFRSGRAHIVLGANLSETDTTDKRLYNIRGEVPSCLAICTADYFDRAIDVFYLEEEDELSANILQCILASTVQSIYISTIHEIYSRSLNNSTLIVTPAMVTSKFKSLCSAVNDVLSTCSDAHTKELHINDTRGPKLLYKLSSVLKNLNDHYDFAEMLGFIYKVGKDTKPEVIDNIEKLDFDWESNATITAKLAVVNSTKQEDNSVAVAYKFIHQTIYELANYIDDAAGIIKRTKCTSLTMTGTPTEEN